VPTESKDKEKSSDEKNKPTKKKIIDEKDVGGGWKPAGKIVPDPFPKTEPLNVKERVEDLKIESKSLKRTKDVGSGWKPSGKTDLLSKAPPPLPANAKKEVAPAHKPPLPTKTKSELAKTPKKADTNQDKNDGENNNNIKNKDETNNRFTTSTPNLERSFDSKVNNGDISNESIIKQAPDEPVSKNNSKLDKSKDSTLKNVSNHSGTNVNPSNPNDKKEKPEDLNEKIEDEESIKDEDVQDEDKQMGDGKEEKQNEMEKKKEQDNSVFKRVESWDSEVNKAGKKVDLENSIKFNKDELVQSTSRTEASEIAANQNKESNSEPEKSTLKEKTDAEEDSDDDDDANEAKQLWNMKHNSDEE
jgi:hypothetical protein